MWENYLNNKYHNIIMASKDINIELKDKTHSLAKVCAVLKGKTMKNYLVEAIEKAIEKDKAVLKNL